MSTEETRGSSKTFCFRCEEIPIETQLALPVDIIHLKGFALRLNASLTLHSDISTLLQTKKVIAFDGDAIHPSSFTKFLINILAHQQHKDNSSLHPQLLAYRLDYSPFMTDTNFTSLPPELQQAVAHMSREALYETWDGAMVTLHDTGHITIGRKEEKDTFDCAPHASPKDFQEVPLYFKTLIPSCPPTERSPYDEMGLQALLDSGSTQVVVVGGGQVIGREYELYETRIPSLHWYVWPVTRAAARDDGQVEECFFVTRFGDCGPPPNIKFIGRSEVRGMDDCEVVWRF